MRSVALDLGGLVVRRRSASKSSLGLAPRAAPPARPAARARARRGRARRRVCRRLAGRPLGLGEERVAVVVQVLEILERPAVGAAPARGGRPGHGAPADLDRADARVLAAHEADGAGRARAHGNALQRDAAEVDVDGGEAVLAVEEAGRRQAVAVLQRLDEAVEPGAQPADQPLRLVEVLVRLGLHALARRAADARAHLGDDARARAAWWRVAASSSRSATASASDRELLGDAAAARDQDPAAVGDVGDADAARPGGRRAGAAA